MKLFGECMEQENIPTIKPEPEWMAQIESDRRLNISSCYQCRKCTNGCPVTFAMDIYPDQVIRLVQLGQRDRVLRCNTIWICAACETCTTRCPNDVDIAGIMDYLKERAIEAGVHVPEQKTYIFHSVFLNDVKRRGRVFEGRLMQSYMIKSGELWNKIKDGSIKEEISLGWTLFRKGRLRILPKGIKAKKEVRKILM